MKALLSRHQPEALYFLLVATGAAACLLIHLALRNPAADHAADNVRWTVEMVAGAALVAFRRRGTAGQLRRTLGWFLAGASAYAFGQLLWDIQTARGTLRFPGFHDLFYLALPACVAAGIVPVLTCSTAAGKMRRATWVNMAAITVLTLTLTLVLYLPVRGTRSALELGVLAAYPVLFFTAFGACVLAVVVRRLAPRPALALLLGGLGCLGWAWLEWNRGYLQSAADGGGALGYVFSFSRAALTVGLALWRQEEAPRGVYHRLLGHLYRLLPLLLVLGTGAGIVYGQHALSRPVGMLATAGALVVIVCAILRQTLLLYEQDQAIATEHLLQQRESHLHAIFENGSDLIFGVAVGADGALRYSTINPAGARLGNIDLARFVGSTPAEYFPPEKAAFYEANYRRCVEAGKTIQYEQTTRVPSGTVVFETTLVPVRDNAGRIAQIMGISRNITAHRTTLEAMRTLNTQLESAISERTRQLEGAYRELEMFSYSVSHDLRSPLRGINGFCAALIEDYGPGLAPEARGYLDRIHSASARMGQIIDDLLQLSRVSRGTLALQEVDLSALAERIAADLRASAPERDAAFEIAPGMLARCDLRLIQNVLENLLGNAWKYTGRQPSARIGFDVAHRDGEAIFRVRDDGAGFDMRFVEKLFQNFQRLHDRTEFEGTGVGLAIVARIVRRHGGRVWAEGEVDRGASFYFTLGKPPETLAPTPPLPSP